MVRKKYVDHQGKPIFVVSGSRSAIRSYQSYSAQVDVVCHHSWRYLTRSENNPRVPTLLHVQHDFPGFQKLDEEFAKAAHACEYQHFTWDIPLIKGMIVVLCGLIVVGTGLLFLGWQRLGNIPLTALLIILTIGMALIAYGSRLIQRREELYHQQATGQLPAISDFPLLRCTYHIRATERMSVALGNNQPYPMTIRPLSSALAVDLYPERGVTYLYQQYRQIYRQHNVGNYLHAGLLALENMSAINCPKLDLDHRLILRAPVPASLEQHHHIEGALASIEIPYELQPDALYRTWGEGRGFPLACEPCMRANDSYTLELRFCWLDTTMTDGYLEECLLEIPPELGPVERVVSGRYDLEHRQVIWRNVPLTRKTDQTLSLTLSVSFRKPLLNSLVLEYASVLHGSYRCQLNGLISGITINRQNLWNVLGHRAINDGSLVDTDFSSSITGDLEIDLRRLSQEHEYVRFTTLISLLAPDHELIENILHTLVDTCKIDVRRIEQAAPRLDPSGVLDTQLAYWDLLCRQYNPDMLHSIDVHVVITGSNYLVHPPTNILPTHIEIWVRCPYDPRDIGAQSRADVLLDMIAEELQISQASVVSKRNGHQKDGKIQSPNVTNMASEMA